MVSKTPYRRNFPPPEDTPQSATTTNSTTTPSNISSSPPTPYSSGRSEAPQPRNYETSDDEVSNWSDSDDTDSASDGDNSSDSDEPVRSKSRRKDPVSRKIDFSTAEAGYEMLEDDDSEITEVDRDMVDGFKASFNRQPQPGGYLPETGFEQVFSEKKVRETWTYNYEDAYIDSKKKDYEKEHPEPGVWTDAHGNVDPVWEDMVRISKLKTGNGTYPDYPDKSTELDFLNPHQLPSKFMSKDIPRQHYISVFMAHSLALRIPMAVTHPEAWARMRADSPPLSPSQLDFPTDEEWDEGLLRDEFAFHDTGEDWEAFRTRRMAEKGASMAVDHDADMLEEVPQVDHGLARPVELDGVERVELPGAHFPEVEQVEHELGRSVGHNLDEPMKDAPESSLHEIAHTQSPLPSNRQTSPELHSQLSELPSENTILTPVTTIDQPTMETPPRLSIADRITSVVSTPTVSPLTDPNVSMHNSPGLKDSTQVSANPAEQAFAKGQLSVIVEEPEPVERSAPKRLKTNAASDSTSQYVAIHKNTTKPDNGAPGKTPSPPRSTRNSTMAQRRKTTQTPTTEPVDSQMPSQPLLESSRQAPETPLSSSNQQTHQAPAIQDDADASLQQAHSTLNTPEMRETTGGESQAETLAETPSKPPSRRKGPRPTKWGNKPRARPGPRARAAAKTQEQQQSQQQAQNLSSVVSTPATPVQQKQQSSQLTTPATPTQLQGPLAPATPAQAPPSSDASSTSGCRIPRGYAMVYAPDQLTVEDEWRLAARAAEKEAAEPRSRVRTRRKRKLD